MRLKRLSVKEFLWRVCVIVLVLTVAFSQELYERYVMAPTIHATTLVTKLTSEKSRQKSGWWVGNGTSVGASKSALQENNDSYFAGLDIVFESVNIFTTGMMDALVAFKASIPPTSSDTATGAGGGAGAAAGAAAGDGSNVTPPQCWCC